MNASTPTTAFNLTADRIRYSPDRMGDPSFELDGYDVGYDDMIWIDRGKGWEMARVDFWDASCGDDPALEGAHDRLTVRILDNDNDHALVAIDPTWRVSLPISVRDCILPPDWIASIVQGKAPSVPPNVRAENMRTRLTEMEFDPAPKRPSHPHLQAVR